MKTRRVNRPVVSIIKAQEEQQSLREALELLPLEEIFKPGDRVVITPNWVKSMAPQQAVVVGPETLRELIQFVKKRQPKKITVAVGSGGEETSNVFKSVGYDRIIQEEAVEFVDLNYGPFVPLKLEHHIIQETPIHQLVTECDVLISFTQLKQHEEATISAAIKNIALAWPPASVHGFPKKQLGIHEDLHGFIAAMTKKIPADLAIVSVDKAMIGTGPSEGKAVNTNGLVIASTDALAADAIGARLMGFLPQAIHYLYELYQQAQGEVDPKKMEIKGIALEEAERIFTVAAYGEAITIDKNNQIKGIHGNQ